MDLSLIVSAVQLGASVGAAFLAAAVVGAFVVGMFRVVTQIDDQSIQLAGRLSGIAIFAYLSSAYLASEVLSFTQRVWGGADFYR